MSRKKQKMSQELRNLIKILLVCILCATIITVIVHFLFKWNSGKRWIIAEWSAGEILNYMGTILSFIGTIILGFYSFTISKQTKIVSEKLFEKEMKESIPFVNIKPEITIESKELEGCIVHFENIQIISSTNAIYIENIPLSEEQKNQHHFIEYLLKISFKNTTNNQIKSAKLLTDSLMLLKSKNGNVECISKFFNNCNRDKIKLFLNFESIDNFSCYIKLYALDNNIAHSILENNSFCISFEIEYESVAGIAIKLFHQLWVERNDAQYIVTSSRTTNLEEK